MAVLYLDGKRLKRQIHASARWLLANEGLLNELNVFPVPDGDTGTNMGMTLKAVTRAISESSLGDDLSRVAATAAENALLGARGNSGVILSQIFKGFSEGIGEKKRANAMDVAHSLKKAYEKAYASVIQPTEGTILTVLREGMEAAIEKAKTESDIVIIIETLLVECRRSLAETPNLLPMLKEANVVDAGAMGFVIIIEGIQRLLSGAELPEISLKKPCSKIQAVPLENCHGYCNEFLINGQNINLADVRTALIPLGDSLLLAPADKRLKVHIHSHHPGPILEKCQKWGILTDIKIEIMDLLHSTREARKSAKNTVIIAVAMGDGFRKILESLGCDYVVKGGPTMNPSVMELNTGVENTASLFGARNFILLPNNGNVIFSAEQIPKLNQDKQIWVIPTRSVPEGFSALLAYEANTDIETNIENMRRAAKRIKTGEVTWAVRSHQTNGLEIKQGDTIAVFDGTIIGSFPDPQTATRHLVETMVLENDEIISIYHGEDIPENVAEEIKSELVARYPQMEVELHFGGQPHYAFIVSVE